MPSQWKAAAAHVNAAIVRRSLLVALIVGPALLWVNQGPLLMFDPAVDYYKVVLTFIVPFIVSLVSGTAARIEASIGRR
jgi:hypothetical protein